MRFNKLELLAIASQPSQNFDKEGVLLFKEKQEGFFRRTEVCVARWYRLRGNLLFYFTGLEQWSDPLGLIVLENHSIQCQGQDESGQWPFQIVFENGVTYKMATYSEIERSGLLQLFENATYVQLKSRMLSLQYKLENKNASNFIGTRKPLKSSTFDPNEVPLCELALSCDNLLCYPHGRPPSPVIYVQVKQSNGLFIQYATTEVIQNCSNPSFSKTIMFRASDGLNGDTLVQLSVYDVIELVSQAKLLLGFANVLLSTIQDTQRLRITLTSNNKTVGFVTINGWRLEPPSLGSPRHINSPLSMDMQQKLLCHKRSHSLPPKLGVKFKLPLHSTIMKNTLANSYQVSYRFHSGLGGDITVHEIMAESKLCFQLPIQFLSICMQREMELLQEILCMGDLDGKWKFRQIELLNTHLYLIKYYSNASQKMAEYLNSTNVAHFKRSSQKDNADMEFAPVNLHCQRMWAYNDTLNKCGFHDIITVGAFAAHTHEAGKSGGLLSLVQQMKEVTTKLSLNSPAASRVQMASDAIQAIKQLRKEIFSIMDKLLSLAKMRESTDMIQLAEDMVAKTRALLTLWDPGLVEEALSFIEWHKLPTSVESNVGVSTQTISSAQNVSNLSLLCLKKYENTSPFDEHSRSLEVSSTYSCNQVEQRPSPTKLIFNNDHFKQTDNAMPQTNGVNYCTSPCHNTQLINILPKNLSNLLGEFPLDYTLNCINKCQNESETNERKDVPSKRNNCNLFSCAASSQMDRRNMSHDDWYPNTDDPEPWDLTQLNIEASVMCLVSKVKFLCGRCGSPAVRLRNQKQIEGISIGRRIMKTDQQSGPRGDEIDPKSVDNSETSLMSSLADTDTALVVAAVDSLKKLVKKGNKFTDGLKLEDVNWLEELQPAMRKLKQAMDGLLKTGRLAHSVLRLKCEHPHSTRALTALQMRRDTCFSQALTAVTTGLMIWLWTAQEDMIESLLSAGLGPLCEFEGLLSLHGDEVAMFGDMVVAIEDLQTVLFTLIKSNHSTNIIPQIIGSRCALNVLIPVPDTLFAKFHRKDRLSFTITAVFFNIGINAKATIAEQIGDTLPQEQSNSDNFDRLNKYYQKYKKIFLSDFLNVGRSSTRTKPLEEVIETMRIVVHKKVPKNYDILHLAALATRQMNGIRLTSCKSAKDRTGMSSTLEQCSVLTSEYHLAENQFSKALDAMRSEGCRRENVFKNIGIRKYAFNKVQRASLPLDYQPPSGTFASTQT